MTASHFLFYLTNSLKPTYIQFGVKYDDEKLQILTFEKLDPESLFFLATLYSYQLIFSIWKFDELINSFCIWYIQYNL